MSMSSIFRKKSKAPIVPAPVPEAPVSVVSGGDPDARAPDTRMLSTLGHCAGTVSTVVEDALLPVSPTTLDFPRRQSSASAMSTASTVLITPTYPTEPIWQQHMQARERENSKPKFEIIEGTLSEESAESDLTDYSQIRVEAPTPDASDESHASKASLASTASTSAWTSTYSSDLFESRSEEYDMSKLLAALGENIQADEQAAVSPFGFETIGRGKDAKFFKDRADVDTEDFYVPTFQTKHTTSRSTVSSGFKKHTPGSRFGGLQEHLNATRQGGRMPPGQARPMRPLP